MRAKQAAGLYCPAACSHFRSHFPLHAVSAVLCPRFPRIDTECILSGTFRLIQRNIRMLIQRIICVSKIRTKSDPDADRCLEFPPLLRNVGTHSRRVQPPRLIFDRFNRTQIYSIHAELVSADPPYNISAPELGTDQDRKSVV